MSFRWNLWNNWDDAKRMKAELPEGAAEWIEATRRLLLAMGMQEDGMDTPVFRSSEEEPCEKCGHTPYEEPKRLDEGDHSGGNYRKILYGDKAPRCPRWAERRLRGIGAMLGMPQGLTVEALLDWIETGLDDYKFVIHNECAWCGESSSLGDLTMEQSREWQRNHDLVCSAGPVAKARAAGVEVTFCGDCLLLDYEDSMETCTHPESPREWGDPSKHSRQGDGVPVRCPLREGEFIVRLKIEKE